MPDRLFMDISGPSQRRLQSYARLAPVQSRPGLSGSQPSRPHQIQLNPPPAAAIPAPIKAPVSNPLIFKQHTVRHQPSSIHSVTKPRQGKSEVLKRQAVHKSAVAIHKATRPSFKFKKEHALVLASLVIFVAGGGLAFYGWQLRQQANAIAGVSTVKPDVDSQGIYISGALLETEPTTTQYKNYPVNNDQLRYLRIPGLNVNARIRPVGLDQTGKLEMTANIFDAGWYKRSSLPGSNGVTLIAAHATGATRPGIFHHLQDLKAGSIIELELGEGSRVRYKVVAVKPYAVLSVNEAMKPAEPGKNSLNLVTYPSLNLATGSAQQGLMVQTTQM